VENPHKFIMDIQEGMRYMACTGDTKPPELFFEHWLTTCWRPEVSSGGRACVILMKTGITKGIIKGA